jgi:outer membrane biogenesis lipoprotein LolB
MRRTRCIGGRRVTVLSLVLSCLVAGCAATRLAPLHPAPAVLPSAAAIDAALAARRASLHSLRAVARLRYRDATQSVASREAIVVARPDRVRVEVLSLFGSVFLLVADDGQMTAYAREENTVYRGQASPQNLERYVRLGLPVDELVDIALGTPPPREGRAQVSFDKGAGAIRLYRSFDQGAQTVWLSEASLPLATEEVGADGTPHWRATFGAYEDHGGVAVATHIALDLPAWSWIFSLSQTDAPPDRSLAVRSHELPQQRRAAHGDTDCYPPRTAPGECDHQRSKDL